MAHTLLNAQQFSHYLLQQVLSPNSIVVDATVGNGHDTLFIAKQLNHTGHIYGFDIQPTAIDSTDHRLKENQQEDKVTLIHDSHANCLHYLNNTRLDAAIFNLGYLPGHDKSIITQKDSTVEAINHLLPLLNKNGLLILVIYDGHPGGQEEREGILSHVQSLNQKQFSVLHYQFLNQQNYPPHVIAIEKLV